MPSRSQTLLIVAAAAVAGIIAGTAAVYVRGSADGNVATADNTPAVNCDDAVATAQKLAPLAKGEVAAFQIATKPEAFGDLAFLAPDGSPTTLSALNGKVTLVNLWATWCVPCRSEMPALDRLEAARGGSDFGVTAINMDVTKPENAKRFLSDIGVTKLAFYSDPKLGVFSNLKRRGLTIGLPTTLLLDGKGCRLGIMEGPAEWDSDDAKALISAAIPQSAATG
jgi:thiol-disulfide isomerase/thioredoxin